MDIYLLRSWTHYEPKPPKGKKRDGVISAGFKPPPGMSAVMLHVGNVPAEQDISDEWMRDRLRSVGLISAPEPAPEAGERSEP